MRTKSELKTRVFELLNESLLYLHPLDREMLVLVTWEVREIDKVMGPLSLRI